MEIAITRQVSRSITECELAFLSRVPIDVAKARSQHAQYEATLQDLGLAVLSLPEEPELPDSVFVEDIALVLDECAVIARPGAASRRPETISISEILQPFRHLLPMHAPATLDGGDVLRLGQQIYVGVSQRTDTQAVDQLRYLLRPHHYEVQAVPVSGCLHLKSAVSEVAASCLLVNPEWIDPGAFEGVKILTVDPSEAYAANVLKVRDTVICSESFPRSRRLLEQAGLRTITVGVGELEKAEGALTCCSLIFTI